MASNIENNELAKAYKGKDLAPDLNIQEFLAGLSDDNPEGLEYPYTCPKCGRQFKTTISLEVHLESFDHNNPPEDYDPCNPEWKPKKRDERLKELSLKTDSAPNSPRPMQTPTQPKGRPQKTPSSRGRKSFGSHRKRKFYRRGSDVTEQAPTKTRVRVDEDGNVTSENLTWAQAQRLVEVEDDASNRIYRLSIFEDLEVDTVEQGKPRPSASRIPVPESDIKEISELDANRTHKLDPDYLKYSPKIDENGVEYFMDDEDHVWLEKVNDTRQKSHGMKPITHDQFEGVIDRLEKDSIFETNSKKNSLDDTDNAVCCVCNDGECNNTNQIIFCDLCNLAVHQECYGVPYIPEGQWLCRRCSFSPSRPVDCVVCPNLLGAFKQTVDNKWCHVVCALWIPEISFQNPVFLEPIDGLRNVPKARWNLKCYICKKSGCGASIQCNKANCYTAFHVTCAQHAGLYMVMRVEKGDNINGITTTNVTKTAYCHCHTPKNWSPRLLKTAERGFDRSREEQLEDRVNEARENICGRRHTQMISKPYIPFEKIPSLINDYIPPQLGRSTAFFQQCLTYWSQKRQIRNGVPLIRRLQSQISKTPASGESDEQKLKMREQLRYWQRLRHDLERARLLTEQIKKREKLKLQEISKSKQLTQLKMYPWGQFLKSCIEELKVFDTHEIFRRPVTDKEAPMYSKIIDEPMDLGTMSKKIDNFQYKCFAAFEYDIALICRNCCHYNDSTTIFYRLGMDYKSKTTTWLKNIAKKVKEERFNTATGTFLADGVEMDTKPEYDFHLDWYSRLAQRQADLEKEKNGSTKTKLLKQCKQDQVKVKRILQKLGHDFEADEVEANGKHPDEETPSSSCSGSNDEKPNGVVTQKNNQINGDHPTTNGTSDPSESNGSSFDDENGVFQGPKIEENGNIVMHDGEQEIKGDSQVLENQVSGDDDHLHNFQPLDLVWAKCSGYPWYPALIFDADLSQDEPILHGDEELPQPSYDIIEIGNKLNRNQDDTERYNLVLFFDARRTWQWLPRNKIALLGKDREFDSQKKNEGKTAALRKSVQKAYSRATQQAQNI